MATKRSPVGAHADATGRSTLLEMTFGLMSAKTIAAALELGVIEQLATQSQTSEELARRAGAHHPSMRRLLRALTGLGVVEVDRGRFRLADLGELLRADVPGSMRPVIMTRCSPEFWSSWNQLADSVRTGQTGWERAHGVPWVEYYQRHPDRWATFNSLMAQQTRDAAEGIAAGYDFSRRGTVVDLGGNDGTLLAAILRAEPRLKGAVFDLPDVVASASVTLNEAGVADRADAVAGDFFVSVPSGYDTYLMKFILHDWDDDSAVTILRNCRTAMSPQARLLVIERVLPDRVTQADRHDVLSDMLMLVAMGGKERTETEFRELFTAAGFALAGVTEPIPPLNHRIIEAAPID